MSESKSTVQVFTPETINPTTYSVQCSNLVALAETLRGVGKKQGVSSERSRIENRDELILATYARVLNAVMDEAQTQTTLKNILRFFLAAFAGCP